MDDLTQKLATLDKLESLYRNAVEEVETAQYTALIQKLEEPAAIDACKLFLSKLIKAKEAHELMSSQKNKLESYALEVLKVPSFYKRTRLTKKPYYVITLRGIGKLAAKATNASYFTAYATPTIAPDNMIRDFGRAKLPDGALLNLNSRSARIIKDIHQMLAEYDRILSEYEQSLQKCSKVLFTPHLNAVLIDDDNSFHSEYGCVFYESIDTYLHRITVPASSKASLLLVSELCYVPDNTYNPFKIAFRTLHKHRRKGETGVRTCYINVNLEKEKETSSSYMTGADLYIQLKDECIKLVDDCMDVITDTNNKLAKLTDLLKDRFSDIFVYNQL